MANVNIKFNGKEFLLSCENGQEDHLKELSVHLNNKFNDLKNSLGNIGENKLLLITSITIMDEQFETKKKIEEQKVEISKITGKFKELKSLVYEYKDYKDKEISNFSNYQSELQNQLKKYKSSYENLVDKATSDIETFIKKHHTDSNLQ